MGDQEVCSEGSSWVLCSGIAHGRGGVWQQQIGGECLSAKTCTGDQNRHTPAMFEGSTRDTLKS